MITLGTSSVFHTWDPSSERFVQVGVGEGKHGLLMIDGKDEVISRRCVSYTLKKSRVKRISVSSHGSSPLVRYYDGRRFLSQRCEAGMSNYAVFLSGLMTYAGLLTRAPLSMHMHMLYR